MALPLRDRRDAGHQAAAMLIAYTNRPAAIVLGLPRGGIPVADEISAADGAPEAFLFRLPPLDDSTLPNRSSLRRVSARTR